MSKRDAKSSGPLDVWRVKCVLSLKNPQMEEMAASVKGVKKSTPCDRENLDYVGGRKYLGLPLANVLFCWLGMFNCGNYLLASLKAQIDVVAIPELNTSLWRTLAPWLDTAHVGRVSHGKSRSVGVRRKRPLPSESCSFAGRNDVITIPRSRIFCNQPGQDWAFSGRFPAVSVVTVGLGGKCV